MAHYGLVSDQTMNRWLIEEESFAIAFKKALKEQDLMFTRELLAAPAGLWQKWAWLKERLHPTLYSLQHRVQIDANHKIEVNAGTCRHLSESWSKFQENHVHEVDAEVIDKD